MQNLIKLINDLEPELIEIVTEVISKEREYSDYLRPRGVKEEIMGIIEKYACSSLENTEKEGN
jgi:hypothetical protein